MATELEKSGEPRGSAGGGEADIARVASTLELETHRLMTVVRGSYCRGGLVSVDAPEVVRALERAARISRRQRRALLRL